MQTKIKHIIVLWFILIFSASAAETSWSGKWHVFWKHGAIVLILEQHGNDVNGSYEPGQGTIKGTIENNRLYGVTENKDGKKSVTITMGQNRMAFFGNNADGDWITGIRVNADSEYNILSVNDSLPIYTFYSFLKLGNQVRDGQYEALEKLLKLLYLDENLKKYRYGKRMVLLQKLYQILDACTVRKYDFNRNVQSDHERVKLHQAGTANTVEVEFVKTTDTGGWKIKFPGEEQINKTLQMLLKARGGGDIDPNSNLKLENPRDTMRTFIEQYKRWNKNGKAYVLSTMNLSAVDPAIWEWQAPLLSYYLLGVLDRISEVVYQEIPNDPKSKKHYVHLVDQIFVLRIL